MNIILEGKMNMVKYRKWLICLLVITFVSCRLASSNEENPSPQTSSSNDTENSIEHLSINKMSSNDDLLFFIQPTANHPYSYFAGATSGIYSANSRNKEVKCLTCNLNEGKDIDSVLFIQPSGLSPNGRNLAISGGVIYKDKSEGYTGFWIIDVHRGEVQIVDQKKCNDALNPTWSPDGKKIAYTDGSSGICIINSKNMEIIFESGIDHFSLESDAFDHVPSGQIGTNFSWSPNSKYLLYDPSSNYIVRVNIDQLTVAVLRPFTPVTDNDYSAYIFPAWSPFGDRILFVSDIANRSTNVTWKQLYDPIEFTTGGNELIFALDLYIMNADGSNQVCFTCNEDNTIAWAYSPSWSPNGKYIAFYGYNFSQLPDKFEEMTVVNIDTGELKKLARFPLIAIGLGTAFKVSGPPQWSKDEKKLVFSALQDGKYTIFLVNEDGSDLQVIAHEPEKDFVFPIWVK